MCVLIYGEIPRVVKMNLRGGYPMSKSSLEHGKYLLSGRIMLRGPLRKTAISAKLMMDNQEVATGDPNPLVFQVLMIKRETDGAAGVLIGRTPVSSASSRRLRSSHAMISSWADFPRVAKAAP